ncbi:MAG: hypothetical protein M1829_001597 [Trizodia sp. TS-e1964]|nr:MAG: hypothetical protein M1829_001597 [Trizodia sp. TS-e1964]
MAVSPATEEAMSRQLFQQLVHQYGNRVLPVWDRRVVKVQRVLERLIPASGMGATNWEVFVIDDAKEKNAFVIPGGKVFVFSGILPICKDDDGLAAVLGHEIAHNVAHHAAERMSSMYVLSAVQIAASFFGIPDFFGAAIIDLAFSKPGTRKQEAEADYIGLLMMAESCYDPRAAVEIWRRMEEAQRDSIPQFLSTHPSNENRRQKILEWYVPPPPPPPDNLA